MALQLMQHPWLQASLPEELDKLNYRLLQMPLPASLQTAAEIERVAEAASQLPEVVDDADSCHFRIKASGYRTPYSAPWGI